jgi:hypothetical protein
LFIIIKKKQPTTPTSSTNSPQPPQQQQQGKAQTYVGGLLTTVQTNGVNGSGAQVAPAAEKCFICEKTVYAMEKIEADKKVYHKQCFKCTSCNCPLK